MQTAVPTVFGLLGNKLEMPVCTYCLEQIISFQAYSFLQAQLLQKVEELTLYVIEQNKKIEKLVKENEVLKNRVYSLENKIQ